MRKDFNGCNVIIYDEDNNKLASVRIEEYNTSENSIAISPVDGLKAGMLCHLLIMSAPVPYSYKGRVHKRGRRTIITLFKGEANDKRKGAHRYKSDMPTQVVSLILDGKVHAMHMFTEGRILNISTGGIRLRTVYNAFNVGDKFQAVLKNNEVNTRLSAEVVSRTDIEGNEFSEFSCKFVGESVADEDNEND